MSRLFPLRPKIASAEQAAAAPSSAQQLPFGIKVLHSPAVVTVDIVFVHGLSGHREKTWTSHGQSQPWPQALLPQKIPGSRILAYGYDSKFKDFRNVASQNRIGHHAENLVHSLASHRGLHSTEVPILFVCHSLGGLICEDALLKSAEQRDHHLQSISSQTRGILFLGTPHRGSELARTGNRILRALNLVRQVNVDIVNVLRTDSEVLERIQHSFQTLVMRRGKDGLPPLQITCCYEELPVRRIGFIVPKASAILPGYNSIGIHRNHMDMSKFTGLDDPGFELVSAELQRWAMTKAMDRILPEPRPDVLCSLIHNFAYRFGRKPILSGEPVLSRAQSLQQMVLAHRGFCKAAIYGLGGAGKTQIALQLAYWVKENKPEYSVFWAPAISFASFEQAYNQIAEYCGVQRKYGEVNAKKTVKNHLESSSVSRKWILILDNADDEELLHGSTNSTDCIHDHLPSRGEGFILFTTRSRKIAVSVAKTNIILISELQQDEAKDYLRKSVRNQLFEENKSLPLLLKSLNYLPLAITQAAAYINQNDITTSTYYRLLKDTDQDATELICSEFNDDSRYKESGNAVAATWLLSFDQLRKTDKAACSLLYFISCIEPKAIPESILPRDSEQQFVRAIGTLTAYEFLRRRENDKVYEMHSLVHSATRIWTRRRGDDGGAREKCIRHISEVFPDDDHILGSSYCPHALRVFRETDGSTSQARFDLGYLLGRCLVNMMRGDAALSILNEVEARGKETLTEEDPYRLATQRLLGRAYRQIGQVKRAIQVLEHVLEVAMRHHAETAATMHELAQSYQSDGQLSKCIVMLEKVVNLERGTVPVDDPSHIASQEALALAYLDNGLMKPALDILELLVDFDKALPETHPNHFSSQRIMAQVYLENGNTKKSIQLLQQIVERESRILEDTDLGLLWTQHELARAYLASGQLKASMELLQHVTTTKKKILPHYNGERLVSEMLLARAYQANGQVTSAIKLFERIVKIRTEVFSEHHPLQLVSQHDLARAFLANNQVIEAIEILEYVLEIRRKKLPANSRNTLRSQYRLAQAYLANGQASQAVDLLEDMAKREVRVLSEDLSRPLEIQHELARAYSMRGKRKREV